MKRTKSLGIGRGVCVLLLVSAFAAQAQDSADTRNWPDPLVLESYSGTIIVAEPGQRPVYYLDVGADGTADYHLSFGPWWYEPASGAVRPDDGATVTIIAAPWECETPNTLMVFEIDGLEWREPVEFGPGGWTVLPAWEPGASMITVTGTIMVDDTYFYEHYYLDIDGDEVPEYQLGFGPHWYEPDSGAVRPDEGDVVTVTGCVHDRDGTEVLAVFEIDGLIWREAQGPAPWSGGWVGRDGEAGSVVRAGNDHSSQIEFPHGNAWRWGESGNGGPNGGGGNGGGQNGGPGNGGPGSVGPMFVEFLAVHPDYLPGAMVQERNRIRFSGFHVNMFDSVGQHMMTRRYGQEDGHMRFMQRNTFRLRYNEQERVRRGLGEGAIGVQYWNQEQQAWQDITEFSVDAATQVVTFTSEDVYSHYAVASSFVAAATDPGSELPERYMLGQNYPNPFNPVTAIPFTVAAAQQVSIRVYDALGVEVATLVDRYVQAGSHVATFDARSRPSGVYLYVIRGEGWSASKPMILLK